MVDERRSHLPLPVHLRLACKDRRAERVALRMVLGAVRLLGVAMGTTLRQMRASPDPLVRMAGRLERTELSDRYGWALAGAMAHRLRKLPERERPYYTPVQRYELLEMAAFFGWSNVELAERAVVCPNTVSNWRRSANPDTRTVGATVKPVPPLRRFADTVTATVHAMSRAGFGGQEMIARVLCRAGARISATTIARRLRENPPPRAPEPTRGHARPNLVARFVHHVWMADVSEVKLFLGATVFMAAIFDGFSRMPLAFATYDRKPNSAQMARLLLDAASRFGSPRYVATDKGGEFIGARFRAAVTRLGARHRLSGKDSPSITGRLERFWRTLKQISQMKGFLAPLTLEELDERLAAALNHYAFNRPHQSLGDATPAEMFIGLTAANVVPIVMPRAQRGEPAPPLPLRIAFAGPHGTLPYLQRVA